MGDGIADDTAGLQALIDATPIDEPIQLPPGTFRTTRPLYVGKRRRIPFGLGLTGGGDE